MAELPFASKVWGTDVDPGPGNEVQVHPDDVAEFQLALQDAAGVERPASDDPSASRIGHVLSDMSRTLHDHEAQFDKSLERVSRTSDPMEQLALQRKLSELYLDHGLAVKVIAKTTQALESLSRMQ